MGVSTACRSPCRCLRGMTKPAVPTAIYIHPAMITVFVEPCQLTRYGTWLHLPCWLKSSVCGHIPSLVLRCPEQCEGAPRKQHHPRVRRRTCLLDVIPQRTTVHCGRDSGLIHGATMESSQL